VIRTPQPATQLSWEGPIYIVFHENPKKSGARKTPGPPFPRQNHGVRNFAKIVSSGKCDENQKRRILLGEGGSRAQKWFHELQMFSLKHQEATVFCQLNCVADSVCAP